jgi:hypothetical protein
MIRENRTDLCVVLLFGCGPSIGETDGVALIDFDDVALIDRFLRSRVFVKSHTDDF